MSISDDEVEAANVADRILRVVRRFIAAEHKHARLLENPETVLATSRDDVDMEHATLVGFTVEQVDQALRIVQRRSAAKVRAIREGDGEATHTQFRLHWDAPPAPPAHPNVMRGGHTALTYEAALRIMAQQTGATLVSLVEINSYATDRTDEARAALAASPIPAAGGEKE